MKKLSLLIIAFMASLSLWGQQDKINITHNPQFNTDNLKPFGTSVISPDVHADRTVTFRLLAPNAKEVTLTGTGPIGTVKMTKDKDGVWSVTIGPLTPNHYRYNFIVDGLKIIDPSNT
ncbi:MAG: esterase, partial [Bacteroidales bacterium]|nr:esterase [Bacteroidales bacterium]